MGDMTLGRFCQFCMESSSEREKRHYATLVLNLIEELAYRVEKRMEFGDISEDEFDRDIVFYEELELRCCRCDKKRGSIREVIERDITVPFEESLAQYQKRPKVQYEKKGRVLCMQPRKDEDKKTD